MTTYGFHDRKVLYTEIDRKTCERVVPMRVLALGMSRTGTDSLRKALKLLGYNDTYHGFAAILENPRDCEMWLEALKAKYDGCGKPYGRAEFDKLLGHCQAVCDIPAICFAEELIRAYPDAKVIITHRDLDSWHNSCLQTVDALVNHPIVPFVALVDPILRLSTRFVMPAFRKLWSDFYDGDFKAHGKRKYVQHCEDIRNLVPKERLLEFKVSQGWQPLCVFLGHEIPEVGFPSGNDIAVFQRNFSRMLSILMSFYLMRSVNICCYLFALAAFASWLRPWQSGRWA